METNLFNEGLMLSFIFSLISRTIRDVVKLHYSYAGPVSLYVHSLYSLMNFFFLFLVLILMFLVFTIL